ncbi:MAG: PCRF domain-containing protein, partial [bacterium]|nr:PCRF domain-containing protein [bacterium]
MAEEKDPIDEYKSDPRVGFLVDEYRSLENEEHEAKKLGAEDLEMAKLAEDDLKRITQRKDEILAQAAQIVKAGEDEEQKFPNEAVLEVRAGAGGEEAALFAEELALMYLKFAELEGWQTRALDESRAALGGYKEASFEIKGKDCYRRLRFET